MTLTRWLGGPNKERMPTDVVAATYNMVENEVPIYYPPFYIYSVRYIYRTELAFQPGSLIVMVGNTQVPYLERGSDYREFEIRDRFIQGYLRFFYQPKEAIDFYGSGRLALNRTRTWISQKVLPIDRDILNQIRLAVANIENEMGLVSTRWTGGTFADSKGTISGTISQPATYRSNIYLGQTIYVKGMFEEISSRVLALAARADVSTQNESSSLILGEVLTPAWIEGIRTIINNIERQL